MEESEAVLRALFEQTVAGIYILDLDGRIVYINARFAELFWFSRAEMIGHSYFEYVPEGEIEARRAGFALLARGEVEARQTVGTFKRADGARLELLTQSTLASYGGVPAIVGVAADVTARRRVERALERASHASRTLSAGNSALMRAHDESGLFQEMCTIALETGGYATAWIGMAEHDDCKSVRPVARAGVGTDDLEQLAIRWDDSEFGQGPTGAAIRTMTPVITRNLDTELHLPSWGDYHRKRGHRAIVALPLIEDGVAFGSITLASQDPDAFDEEEVALLIQLASDISFGVMALRNRSALRATEQRSREHATRLEVLWKIVSNPRLSGDELTRAMLDEASKAIRPGQPYAGALFRVDGDTVVVVAVSETPEYVAAGGGSSDLVPGLRVPIAGTAIENVLGLGNGTHSWDDMQTVFATVRVRENRWRSAIVTTFESGGSTYLLWFVSTLQTGSWEAQDHAYVEVIGSYFASQAQMRWQFDQIQYHQTHDVLTGLLNRSQFRSQARMAAIKSDGYAVVAVNVDGFADVNETYGNMIGDALLVEVAAGLSERTRAGEIAGRLGGDVFAVFIPSPGSLAAVHERAVELAERFRQPFSTGDREGKEFVALTASFGLAVAPQHGDAIDTIISHAGVAASAAKARGRGAFAFYDVEMEGEVAGPTGGEPSAC